MDVSKIHTTNASLKWFILFIAIISIALLSYPAKAETGTIQAINETPEFNYVLFGASVAGVATDYTHMRFDSADYNTVTRYLYHSTTVAAGTFPDEANATTFTITSGGTGSGYVSYDKSAKNITWTFSSSTRFTSNNIVLSYAQNIFASWVQTSTSRDDAMSTTVPMCLGTNTNLCARLAAPADYHIVYFLGSATTVNYTITYPADGIYQAFIDKSGSAIANNATLHSRTEIQFSETSYNKVNYTIIEPQLDGIYINLSMANGGFEDVLINASGIGTIVYPNTSNPNAPNCPVNCIETSKPTYNNTESVNVFGSFYPATTTVTDCLFFGFICTDTTISTESTTGYVFISTAGSTSPIKFLSFTPDLNNNYNLFTNLDIGTYQAQLIGFAGPGSTCTGGIVYDFPFIPLGCYYPHNITTFNVVNASGNLSIVWQTKISNSTAIYGDTVTVAWSNVTANDTVVIYDQDGVVQQRYNINQSTVRQIPVFIPLFNIGVWNATIYNASNHNHNVSAYLNVVPPGSVDVNNSFGITMYWSKAADVINNPTFLNWNTGTYTGRYNISILQDGTEIRRNSYYGVPGQAQQASYTFGEPGAYIAQFLDYPNQTVQAQADIFISATTTTGGGTGGTTNESGNNLVGSSNLILNIPWIGLMVLIVVIFGLVKNNVQGGNFVFAVAITTSIEAVIGLWEEWGIYITVLSWLLVGVFFKLNKAIEV